MTAGTGARPLPAAAAPARIAVAILLAAVVAAIGNTVVALLVGVIQGRHLAPGYLVATVVGVLIGVVGWTLVRALVPRPSAVLRILVPVVVVLSVVPLPMQAAAGMSTPMIVGLMVMHVVVAVPTVLALRRVLPV
ncbi:hypothetical protein [Pseudonocardia sp. HH130630-07]|uniref:hypothetical protein n=1 Tax=Pseudonocardia sp. HH130630-07 TaxID=1690815 RepID=UPI00081519BD|nr:hypothetical protein [Pseudonocardia sp. HH130630-07]ANY08625.1 hypothetical protein AFB00_22795 [Pseudonocardia sp. HH130630-07]